MKSTSILGAALLSSALLIALAPAANATPFPDLTYNVTLNLGSLSGYANAPFGLDLQLATGSGNVTNTVTLSNFVFTGGTTTGTDYNTGGVSGAITSSLVLTDSSLDNEFEEGLSAGVTQVTFHVDQTPNAEEVSSGTAYPEQFNVAILDNNLNYLPTSQPSGQDLMVESDLGPSATVNQYTLLATPEPSSTVLSFVVVLGMLGLVLRRRHQA
jgi:hypothetical protein